MNSQFVLAAVTSLLTSSGLWGLLQLFLSSKQKKADQAKEAREADIERRRTKEQQDSQSWYQESRHHYAVAKKEAIDARRECSECTKELRKTRNAIYTLLEDLEEQVLPMLLLPGSDATATRGAMRIAIQKARKTL